ncbi:Dps family protein [Streptomyces sp. NPDC060010]|uniref:Dps family protein n=1 Tax=Streptomyces sp. NPDC060010 TaxID=3347036 RepID=UPI0036AEBFA9
MPVTITGPLAQAEQDTTAHALQGALVDLLDLSLTAEQAHWALLGPHFRSLHQHLDELVTTARDFADTLAERAATIGTPPDGRSATITATSALPPFPDGWVKDTDALDLITTTLSDLIGRTRRRIEDTAGTDPVSQDLLIALAGELEKHHWMLQAAHEH